MEESLRKALELEAAPEDPSQYSPLALAYMGDCVYELLIRTAIISRGNRQVQKLHKETTALVNAASQARLMRELEPLLTEDERTIFKRGRNARSTAIARHASIADYRMATGLEALLGYLYLSRRMDRAVELVGTGLEKTGEWNQE